MINERFSTTEFEKLELGSKDSKALHKALEEEIAAELHKVVRLKFREISQMLVELGHNLSEDEPEYDSDFSSWSYEYNNPENEHSPRIWLNTQAGVMSGYERSGE